MTATKNITAPATPAETEEVSEYVFSRPIERFDLARMKQHNQLLESAGRLLNQSHDTALAISVIADIVRRSTLENEAMRPHLGRYQEDGLMAAIYLLASQLCGDLGNGADHLAKRLTELKEGK
jgi:hypothetical protein